MNNFANQTGGGGSPVSNRVALAEACDVACDSTTRRRSGAPGAAALGGLGTIGANQPHRRRHLQCRRLRRRPRPARSPTSFRARRDRGLHHRHAMGRRASTAWAAPTPSRPASTAATPRTRSMPTPWSATPTAGNQMWRNIPIPGLRQRTAQGRTGANQFYGQLETGYRFDLGSQRQRLRHAVRPPAGLHRHPERLHRDRRAVAQPHGGAADHQLAALGDRRAARRRRWISAGARSLRCSSVWAGATSMPTRPAGDGDLRRRAGDAVHDLRRGAAARRRRCWASRPTPRSPRRPRSISATRATSPGQDSAHALTAGVRMTW